MSRALVATILAATACGDSGGRAPREIYYLVTHGATTDVGFWGEVLAGGDEQAAQLGVEIEPLHPVSMSSGAELDDDLQQAIDAAPAGIIATVWGDGMIDKVRAANTAAIPLAALNVYPDPAQYGALAADGTAPAGKGGLVLYSGQNDAIAAVDVTHGLVCHAGVGKSLVDGSCEGTSIADAWSALTTGHTVRAVCILHQQSAGVVTRCNTMEHILTAELGLPADAFDRVAWDESIPNAGRTAIASYFGDPAHAGVDRFVVLANGHNGVSAYVGAELSAAVKSKVTLATFDVSDLICQELVNGELAFASAQGQRDQARMALAYLYAFVHDHALPADGQRPDGSADGNWTTSPDGFRWYRTGPQLLARCPS
jgi:ABC-type sugar transport system substrate-binding protein